MDDFGIIREIKKDIVEGKITAIIGSSFFSDSINNRTGNVETWWDHLIKTISETLMIVNETSQLNEVLSMFVELHGEKKLNEMIVELTDHPTVKPCPEHSILASLPVKNFVSLNLDHLLEVALEEKGREVVTVNIDNMHEKEETKNSAVVWKIYGDVVHPPSITVTPADFDSKLNLAKNFLRAVDGTNILVLGCSKYDIPFIHKIFSATTDINKIYAVNLPNFDFGGLSNNVIHINEELIKLLIRLLWIDIREIEKVTEVEQRYLSLKFMDDEDNRTTEFNLKRVFESEIIKKGDNILLFSDKKVIVDVLRSIKPNTQGACHIYIPEFSPRNNYQHQTSLDLCSKLSDTKYDITIVPDLFSLTLIKMRQVNKILMGLESLVVENDKPVRLSGMVGMSVVSQMAYDFDIPSFVFYEKLNVVKSTAELPVVFYQINEGMAFDEVSKNFILHDSLIKRLNFMSSYFEDVVVHKNMVFIQLGE